MKILSFSGMVKQEHCSEVASLLSLFVLLYRVIP